MSGLEISLDTSEFDTGILLRLEALAHADTHELMDSLGALGVSQTQARINHEKTTPDGTPWAPNRRGGSILVLEGHLLGSIDHHTSGDETRWGSSLIYAAIHQTGGTIRPKSAKKLHFKIGGKYVSAAQVTIPARPFLGLSDDNKTGMTDLINLWIGSLLQ